MYRWLVLWLAWSSVSLFALTSTLARHTISPEYVPPVEGQVKVAFLDADWTLRISKSGKFTSFYPDDVVLLPGVVEKIRELNQQGFLVVVVSNQLEVPTAFSAEQAELNFQGTIERLAEQGARIDYFDFGEGGKPNTLKPNPYMGMELSRELKRQLGKSIDWGNSIMVGDAAYTQEEGGSDFSNVDRKFKENLGIGTFFEPNQFFDWDEIERFTDLDTLRDYSEGHGSCNEALASLAHI